MIIDPAVTASFDVEPQRGFSPLWPQEFAVPAGDQVVTALNAQATFAGSRELSRTGSG